MRVPDAAVMFALIYLLTVPVDVLCSPPVIDDAVKVMRSVKVVLSVECCTLTVVLIVFEIKCTFATRPFALDTVLSTAVVVALMP